MVLFFPLLCLPGIKIESNRVLGTIPNKVGIEGKVLIIDDDVDFQFMVGTMLRSSGYVVKALLEEKLHTT